MPSVRSLIALRELGRAGAELAARGAADELGRPPRPRGRRAAAGRRRRSGAGRRASRRAPGHVGLGVAEGGEQQQRAPAGGAREVAQEQQRRRVGPVPVLEHEQHRPPAADAGEQVGHRRVQPVALGVRDRPRPGAAARRPGPGRSGSSRVSSPPAGAERGAQLVRVGRPARGGRAPRRTARRACARPRRRRRRGRARRRPPPRAANSRTSRLLPEPGSPPSSTTRRPSPSRLGISARSVSSSAERPTNGNVDVRQSEPGRSCMPQLALGR